MLTRQICKIKPLINRKVINQLQSFDVKMDNISAFKEIGMILQKANINNGMISVKEKHILLFDEDEEDYKIVFIILRISLKEK